MRTCIGENRWNWPLVITISTITVAIIFLLGFVPYAWLGKEEAGTFGDSFGAVNALFSAITLAGVILTLIMQMQELAQQREELKLTRRSHEETSSLNFLSTCMSAAGMIKEFEEALKGAPGLAGIGTDNHKMYTMNTLVMLDIFQTDYLRRAFRLLPKSSWSRFFDKSIRSVLEHARRAEGVDANTFVVSVKLTYLLVCIDSLIDLARKQSRIATLDVRIRLDELTNTLDSAFREFKAESSKSESPPLKINLRKMEEHSQLTINAFEELLDFVTFE